MVILTFPIEKDLVSRNLENEELEQLQEENPTQTAGKILHTLSELLSKQFTITCID